MKILVTGCIGFIGYHLCHKLLENSKNKIFGIDNINNYYDVNLKKNRLQQLKKFDNFIFKKIDISNNVSLSNNFKKNKYDIVINLAAQAGVRYSIENPKIYFQSNLEGFFNIIENSRIFKIKHLIHASTSSVYGDTKKYPTKETDNTDNPLSFYAATKKSNEVMAYSYSNIYKLPITILRFFTVYGPYGRPDMSLYKFTESIIKNKPINLFNNGDHVRDFTYISDVIQGITKIIYLKPKQKIPYQIFNVSSNNPKSLKFFIKEIEKNCNKVSTKKLLKLQKGDVHKTHGSNTKLKNYSNFKPQVKVSEGINKFVKWFNKFYKDNHI
tara:strand:+ start:2554 stop:3531 length:978 start_codon:yes stop_codon:yes gene_type:complete